MRAGRLRHDLQIYQLSDTPDAYGDIGTSYTLTHTVKCRISRLGGREAHKDGGDISTVKFDIHVRYDEDLELLAPDSELDVTGRRLKVLQCTDPDGMRRVVKIMVEERR